MTELYRRKVVGQADFEGDKDAVTLHYEYERDEQAEKDAELGAMVRRLWLVCGGECPDKTIAAALKEDKP